MKRPFLLFLLLLLLFPALSLVLPWLAGDGPAPSGWEWGALLALPILLWLWLRYFSIFACRIGHCAAPAKRR